MLSSIIKAHIEPLLKHHGFKKNNLTWNKSLNGLTQVLNFQLSRFNIIEAENFTINLGVFYHEVWEICWAKKNPKFIREEDCFPRIRINRLIDDKEKKSKDYWWKCTPETDQASLTKELNELISLKCLPFLESMTNVKNVIDFYSEVEITLPIEIIYMAIIYSKAGDYKASNYLLEKASAISPPWAQKANMVRAQII